MYRSLWKEPDFLRLWFGQTISELGSRITRDGLPLLAVITLGASSVEMGYLAAIGSLPALIFGLIAGVWVDRLPRKPVMIVADLGRAILLFSIPLAAIFHRLQITQLYVVMALVGLFSIFFNVAYRSYLPSLVERDNLVDGNSKLSLSSSVAELAGPGLAGALVQWLTAPFAILLDAVSFLVSVISLVVIRKPEPVRNKGTQRRAFLKEIQVGVVSVWQNPILRAMAISAGFREFFGNFIGVLYALFAIRELGLGAALLGITITVGGAGDFLGSFASTRLVRAFGLGATLIGASLLAGLTTSLIPLAGGSPFSSVTMLMGAQLFGDALFTIYAINEVSLRQATAPDELLGRTSAAFQMLENGIGPLGAIAGGILGNMVGIRETLWIAVAGITVSTLWLVFSPIRQLKTHPLPVEYPDSYE